MENRTEMVNTFNQQIDVATAQGAIILFLCFFGLVLNIPMLVIFFTKKQVRRTVYTAYMVQISVTDILVCVVWIVISALSLSNLPSKAEVDRATANYDPGVQISHSYDTSLGRTSKQAVTRFVFALYNFHYYNNIFLLATMSVERCVAVWRSLHRCQKYQFKRKFIYAVSAFMWVLAFACALPAFLDRSLIDSSKQPTHHLNITGRFAHIKAGHNWSDMDKIEKYVSCFQPYHKAVQENSSYVADYGGISVVNCVDMMERDSLGDYGGDYTSGYGNVEGLYDENYDEYLPGDGADYDDINPETESFLSGEKDTIYELPSPTDPDKNVTVADTTFYGVLFHLSWKEISDESEENGLDLDNACSSHFSQRAMIYNVVVNLVIGFFVPFVAIVVSYSAIAIMIGSNARDRLKSAEEEEGIVNEDSVGKRRKSDFLKLFADSRNGSVKAVDKTSSKIGQLLRSSPVLRRSMGKGTKPGDHTKYELKMPQHTDTMSNYVQQRQRFNSTNSDTNVQFLVSPGQVSDPRPRLSSYTAVQLRRTSGGSNSSAESFPTDQTSIQTSPGVRLSAPSFLNNQDPRASYQRTSSADSGTGTSSSNQSNNHVKRWSSDVFRQSVDDEGKRLTNYEHQLNNVEESVYDNHTDSVNKRVSLSPSRGGENCDSTTELYQPHARLYTQKNDKRGYNRQVSSNSNRSRAYSAASRASAGGGTLRKNLVHKNVHRHNKVSRTVLIYVGLFSLCWLPQRIFQIIYVTDGMAGYDGVTCHGWSVATRVVSFFSVVLNPLVYATTQREIRHLLRHTTSRICKCVATSPFCRAFSKKTESRDREPSDDVTGIAEHNLTSDDVTKRERHARNREIWSRLASRLGKRNPRISLTANSASMPGEKKSDGTIDEEEKESSSSYKLLGGWDEWEQMIDMASTKDLTLKNKLGETIL